MASVRKRVFGAALTDAEKKRLAELQRKQVAFNKSHFGAAMTKTEEKAAKKATKKRKS